MIVKIIVFCIISYLLGSIPFGLIIGKLRGKDIRKEGSKNIGATNVFRVVGKVEGIITLILDVLKGVIPVIWFPSFFAHNSEISQLLPVLFGFFAFCGHIWTIFLKFKGGKGVATALGIFTALAPKAMFITAILGIIIIYKTRYVSLGSLIGCYVFVVFNYIIYKNIYLTMGSLLFAIIITWKHRGNIERLLKGIENKI